MNRLFFAISLMTLCGLISESSCNSLMEARLSGFEKEIFKMNDEISEVKHGLEKMAKDIESLNEAVVKLVFTLLENKPEAENAHDVERREVISENPLTNLPIGDLSALRGAPGKDGMDGKDGRDGSPGAPGKDGESLGAGGAVYSRWGRTTCGDDSKLLYAGYAGGSNYDQLGGGTNMQCMPLDPKYNKYYTGSSAWYGSWIAGVEYESHGFGIFLNSAYQQNAPCARCYTNNRSALMMIPAKRDCADGWTKEYEGYLMASYHNRHHQTTFECIDESPEYINGERANDNGGLLYFIRTQCSRGGHCPPYEANKELTCVVCSK